MDRPVKLLDDGMRDTMKSILQLRDQRPEIFRRRLTEQEGKKGIIDPDNGDYTIESKNQDEIIRKNNERLKALKEDQTDEEATFDVWKGQVYDMGKRLYGVEKGFISDKMLEYEWSQGTNPKELVMSMARKNGLEQIADPNDF